MYLQPLSPPDHLVSCTHAVSAFLLSMISTTSLASRPPCLLHTRYVSLPSLHDLYNLSCLPTTLVSLVVTEIFDAGLIGEQTLSTIHHAWKHLLQNCDIDVKPRMLPSAATVFVCAVESESIRKQNRFLYPGLPYLDLTDIDMVCQTGMFTESEDEFEPYTSERLPLLRSGYVLLTSPAEFKCINFNNSESLDKCLAGGQEEICLKVDCNGRLDAIAVWFHLHLNDTLSLSSAPEASSCWEQAVFPVLPCHLIATGEYNQFLPLFPSVSLTLSSPLHFLC
ncbi:hypothetical protein LSAT2_015369 [Lamellibrachia satsuma]|nr:hypothetical protein LSAT2_015369 [Lamellibrachia satsuma]